MDAGLWGIYAGVSKKKIREVAEVIIAEMRDFSRTLTEVELQRAKNHLKGNLILGLESTNSRMNNLARQEIYFNRYISPEEILKSVDMVNMKQIRELSERLINNDMFAVTALGPLQKNILDGIVG
jgi:predicted Zn-dependent peptidase